MYLKNVFFVTLHLPLVFMFIYCRYKSTVANMINSTDTALDRVENPVDKANGQFYFSLYISLNIYHSEKFLNETYRD